MCSCEDPAGRVRPAKAKVRTAGVTYLMCTWPGKGWAGLRGRMVSVAAKSGLKMSVTGATKVIPPSRTQRQRCHPSHEERPPRLAIPSLVLGLFSLDGANRLLYPLADPLEV